MGIGTVYHYTGGVWVEETSWLNYEINDSLTGRTRVLTLTISDPRNSVSSTYTAYKQVKIVERITGSLVFLGRVDASEPQYDEQYGQIQKIYISDWSRELFERKVDSDYSASAYRRSQLIDKIIDDYTYSGTGTPTNIETSGSTATINKKYSKCGKCPAEIIEELAKEDFWTNQTWTKVWGYHSTYTDYTTAANTTGSPINFLQSTTGTDYFYIGQNNPFLGAKFVVYTAGNYTGLFWQYWNGSTWVNITDNKGNSFNTTGLKSVEFTLPMDWATNAVNGTTAYWIRAGCTSYVSTAVIRGDSPTYTYSIECIRGCGYDWYVDDTKTFQYFRRGSKPAGGAAAGGLSVGLNVDEAVSLRGMLADYRFNDDPRETITRVLCYGTSASGTTITGLATNSTLEASLGIVKEKVDYVWGSNMTDAALQTYCNDRAQSLLTQSSGTITRGVFKIFKYPYYGAGKTLVRVGDLVHIHCTPKNINDDFLVLSVKYTEPPGTAELQVVSRVFGRAYSPFDLTTMLQGLTSGQDISVASARIQDLVVDDAKINTCSINKLTAGSLAVTGALGAGDWTTATGTGQRVKFSAAGIEAWNSSNQKTVYLGANGSGWLGASGSLYWNSSGVVGIHGSVLISSTVSGSAINFSSWSLDNVADGGTYSRVKSMYLTAGQVKLDTVVTGTYACVLASGLTGGQVKLDNTVTGTYAHVLSTNIQSGSIKLDNTVTGTYALVRGTNLSGGNVLLDNTVTGTYAKTLATDIQSGRIVLTASNYWSGKFSGEWYQTGATSGVDIDATYGINIYGKNNALTTRQTKTGTIQCYVGADGTFFAAAGNILFNSGGAYVRGKILYIQDIYGNTKGGIGYLSPQVYFQSLQDSGYWGCTSVGMYISESGKIFWMQNSDLMYIGTSDYQTVIGASSNYHVKRIFASPVLRSFYWVGDANEGELICAGGGSNTLWIYSGGAWRSN